MNFKKPNFWDYKRVSFWSILLLPFSIIYLITLLIIQALKNREKFSIPIICVGNIYLGGTGKTPVAREVFNIAKSLNKNPAFIKKYYDYLVDEVKMLEKTGKVFPCKKREEGISSAITKKHDVAILDDGFQDLSINSNFSILCFNSNQLIGNGFVIPSGPLRENLSAIRRSDCIIINGEKNLEFEKKLTKSMGGRKIPIFYSKYKINNLEKFIKKEIIAFAGIGNPSNFFNLLKENNLNLKRTFSFPDHHNYSVEDFNEIVNDESALIVTTEKDYYRLSSEQKKNCCYAEVSLNIEKKDILKNLISNHL